MHHALNMVHFPSNLIFPAVSDYISVQYAGFLQISLHHPQLFQRDAILEPAK